MKKDFVVNFTGFKKDKNSKGQDRFIFYMDQETAKAFSEALQKENTSGRGVKLDMHMGERVNKATGSTFLKPFMFVKEKQEAPTQGNYNKGTKVAETIAEDDIEAQIQKLKELQASKNLG